MALSNVRVSNVGVSNVLVCQRLGCQVCSGCRVCWGCRVCGGGRGTHRQSATRLLVPAVASTPIFFQPAPATPETAAPAAAPAAMVAAGEAGGVRGGTGLGAGGDCAAVPAAALAESSAWMVSKASASSAAVAITAVSSQSPGHLLAQRAVRAHRFRWHGGGGSC